MTKKIKVETEIVPTVSVPTTEDLGQLMTQFNGNKSNVMRYLSGQNWSRTQISKFMSVRYQYVRNVLTKELKKSS